jgi:hypothetical protein
VWNRRVKKEAVAAVGSNAKQLVCVVLYVELAEEWLVNWMVRSIEQKVQKIDGIEYTELDQLLSTD